MGDVLSVRALNRATLDWQLLLRHATMSAAVAVEHLVGLQTQATLTLRPFIPLPREQRTQLTDEGAMLLAFHVPGVEHDIRWARPESAT
jgi:hypothetical protein